MKTSTDFLWVERYRPQEIKDCILPKHLEKTFQEMVKKQESQNLLFYGTAGVGKTTVVNQFAKQFGQYIYLNLETPADKQPFLRYTNLEELLQGIFFLKNQLLSKKANTLIFIDEIQEVPEALNILRYFHEQEPDIKVIS